MTAEYFHEDRAAFSFAGRFITAAHAKVLFEQHQCNGDIESGFEYWTQDADGLRRAHVQVTPVDTSLVPSDVLERLGQIAEAP